MLLGNLTIAWTDCNVLQLSHPLPSLPPGKTSSPRLQAVLEQMPRFHPHLLKAYSQGKCLLKLIEVSVPFIGETASRWEIQAVL